MAIYFTKKFATDIYEYVASKKTTVASDWLTHLPKEDTIPLVTIDQLIQKAILQTGDIHLGLHLGESFMLKATQSVNELISNNESIENAFQSAAQFSQLISNLMESSVIQEADMFAVEFDLHPDVKQIVNATVSAIVDTTLVCVKQSIPFLTGVQLYPSVVHFPYPRPRKINEYYRIFNCPIRFNCRYLAIYFPEKVSQLKTLNPNQTILQKLKRDAALQLKKLPKEPPFTMQVKRILVHHFSPDLLDIKQVAQLLLVTPRTIQRQLKKENTSFSQLLGQVKMNLGKYYLQESTISIAEIAFLIGYSESSAFIRAFKKEHLQTPTQFRKHFKEE